MCASSLLERPDMAPLLALPKANSTSLTEMEPVLNAPTIQSAEAQAQAEATISKDVSRVVLDLKRRFDAQLARDRTSFDTIKGELTKLTSMAAQLVASLDKQSSAAASPSSSSLSSPVGASSVVSTQTFASVSATSASTRPSTTAYVAQQVFGEMPTPISWQGTDGTAPNYCSGHHDPIQSTCVSNLSEQNLDYFLDQAASETVFDVYDDKSDACSNEFIPMFTDTPEQLTEEKEKCKSHQASECFSKPTFSPQRPTASTVGVFSLTNEQSICDLEKLKDGENLLFAKQEIEQLLYGSSKAYKCRTCEEESQGDEKILWDKSVCRTATEHSVLFFLWDPGIESILVFYKWLHIQIIQLVHCSAIHACDFLPTHLPPTQITAYCPSNVGFVHRQGVHENCSAKQLLLCSQKYLQIREMDIIFITYLPP